MESFILYHFPTSPYARRVRLVLALKGRTAELRDSRANPEHAKEVQRLNPLHKVPVLVDGERVVCDSTAICHYLDRKLPAPPLWPDGLEGAEAFEIAATCDAILGTLADLGMRCAPLHDHPAFPTVRDHLVSRAQRGLERLAERAARVGAGHPIRGHGWSGADIALYTTVEWLQGLPARALTYPPSKSVVELGWTLPQELAAWADSHKKREDVLALG